MEEKNTASEAASIMGKKSVESRKARLGKKGFSDIMKKAAKQPRPNRRKKLSTGEKK